MAGRLALAARVAWREAERRPAGGRSWPALPPSVTVLDDASAVATVVEVRASDTPGLLYRVTAAIAEAGADIATARVATLGAEAIDVFYLTDAAGARLSPQHPERPPRGGPPPPGRGPGAFFSFSRGFLQTPQTPSPPRPAR